jgi:hypothetical protein
MNGPLDALCKLHFDSHLEARYQSHVLKCKQSSQQTYQCFLKEDFYRSMHFCNDLG